MYVTDKTVISILKLNLHFDNLLVHSDNIRFLTGFLFQNVQVNTYVQQLGSLHIGPQINVSYNQGRQARNSSKHTTRNSQKSLQN